MKWLSFTSLSVPVFAFTLWMLAFNIVLWRIKDKSTPTKLLIGAFVCTFVQAVSLFISHFVHTHWIIYDFISWQLFLVIPYLFTLTFTYHFPKKHRAREAKIVFLITCLAILIMIGLAVHFLYHVKVYGRETSWLFYATTTFRAMGSFWFIAVLLRQTVSLSTEHLAGSLNSIESSGRQHHLSRIARLQAVGRHLLRPQGRKAMAARAFSFISLVTVLDIGLFFLTLRGALSPQFADSTSQLILLVTFYYFTKFYFNYSPEPTNITTKLMLGALTLVLIVISLAAMIVMPRYEREYDLQRLAEVEPVKQALLKLEPNSGNEASLSLLRQAKLSSSILAVVVRPPSQEDDPAAFTFLYNKDDSFNQTQFTELAASWKQRRLAQETNQVLHQNPGLEAARAHEEALRQVNANYYPSKLGSYFYRPARSISEQAFSGVNIYPFVQGERQYEVWFDLQAYMAYTHQRVVPLIWLMLMTAVFVFFVFPFLYSLSLVKPIRGLLTGVKQVNEGNLDTQVPVYYPDEIGYLAESFNTMVRSIKIAQERLLANAIKDAEREIERQKEKARLAVVEVENERRAKELEEARQLQLSMLPKTVPQLPHLEIAAYMKTASEVGGDYYDFHLAEDGTLTVAIGDATGHGMKAGTLVASIKSLFVSLAYHPDIPHIFHRMSRVLKEMKLRGLFMAMTMIKVKDKQLTVSIAGMPPLFIYRAAQQHIEEIALKAMPLGGLMKYEYKQQELMLSSGDVVVLMSDGLPERFNAESEMLDYRAIKDAVTAAAHQSPGEIIKHFVRVGDEWSNGRPQDDDVTFVVLKVRDRQAGVVDVNMGKRLNGN